MHVLLLVDGQELASVVQACLEAAGHSTELGGRGLRALRRAATGDHQVLVLGRRSAGSTGTQATKTLRAQAVWTPILLVDGTLTAADRVRALKAGADDALTFRGETKELLARVEALARRAQWPLTTAPILHRPMLAFDSHALTARLSSRQRQVLQLIASGLTDRHIAAALRIQPRTARFHVALVMAKLGADNRTHAVALGARLGLLSEP